MFRRRRRRYQRYILKPKNVIIKKRLKAPNLLTKLIIITGLFSFIIFCGATVGIIFGFVTSMPDLRPIIEIEGMEYWELPTKVFSNNDELIAIFSIGRRELVKLSDIPDNLIKAIIATEDAEFYEHCGINLKGILRAFLANLKAGRIIQGGSTITQQLVKNLFLTQKRTYRRKIQEIILAIMVEKRLTKNEILERYFNKIYFGHGNYGVETAALFYFDKHVSKLDLAECAMLAGLPSAPNRFSPFAHPEAAIKRQALVLSRMEEEGFITSAQAAQAREEFKNKIKELAERRFAKVSNVVNVAPYFTEYIRRKLSRIYGESAIYKGGLRVYTTLDVEMQKAAEEVLSTALSRLNKNKTQKNLTIEGALIAIEPSTGYIKAMVGGSGFTKDNQVNRVVQAHRQSGSAFKPFVYAAAIDLGFTPATLLEDTPVTYVGNDGKEWEPQNYDRIFRGTVTLREAFEKSINVASIRLLEQITPRRAAQYAYRMGIKSKLNVDLSLVLGTSEVTPMEMAVAYIPFVNQGIKTEPIAIKCIKDKDGMIIEERMPQEERVLSPQTAYIMTSLMQGVVKNGTAKAVIGNRLGRPVAGKTGTTNDFVDAWFVGFTPQLVAAVWIGYDEGQFSMGHGMCGGRVAAPIWRDFMMKIIDKMPAVPFHKPNGVVCIAIDQEVGLLATKYCPKIKNEYFIQGTEPKEYCYAHTQQQEYLFEEEFAPFEFDEHILDEIIEEDFDKVMLEE
jgi:penicillin-binding protein 1A